MTAVTSVVVLTARERRSLSAVHDSPDGIHNQDLVAIHRTLAKKGLLSGPGRHNEWRVTPAGLGALTGTPVRLTTNERRALRQFRDHPRRGSTRVHAHTRHALEAKGLVRGSPRGWILTAAGHAALATEAVVNIFDDLFEASA